PKVTRSATPITAGGTTMGSSIAASSQRRDGRPYRAIDQASGVPVTTMMARLHEVVCSVRTRASTTHGLHSDRPTWLNGRAVDSPTSGTRSKSTRAVDASPKDAFHSLRFQAIRASRGVFKVLAFRWIARGEIRAF